MTSTEPSIRYHSLDAVRAFALLLGVVFHASESFIPEFPGWAIIDNQANYFVGVFVFTSHIFRLSLFFLMAGFFARLVYHKKGEFTFIWERFQRIIIPLVVGWIILKPITTFVWFSGMIKSGNPLLKTYTTDAAPDPFALTINSFLSGNQFTDFNFTHLWFLYYLFVIYIIALLIRRLFVFDTKNTMLSKLNSYFEWTIFSRFNILILTIPTSILLWTMGSWIGIHTPDKEPIPNIPVTCIYLFIFGIGWFFHRNVGALVVFQTRWKKKLVAASILSLLLLGIYLQPIINQSTHFSFPYAVFCIGYSIALWCWVFGLIGMFMTYFSSPNATVRYIADASYWIYILHLPIVVYLQIWVAYWELHWIFKLLVINGIAFILLFLTYHLFVRSTFIGKQLNGKKYPYVPIFKKSTQRT